MRQAVRTLSVIGFALSMLYVVAANAQEFAPARGGAVFVMTNNADRNEVISFARSEDGSLREIRRFSTGGRGTGGLTDPLESQGSLTLSSNHDLLFAVNGGSGELSVFRVHGANLSLVDKVPSGGSEPNAVAQHGGLVYVVNVGGSSEVVGFRLSADGHLKRIANSTRFLTTNNSEAASLAFSPDGQFLLVTERATNNVDVFRVLADGTLSSILPDLDLAPGTFALTFAPGGVVLVSETGPAGGSNASTVSSYSVAPDGTLSPISIGVPTLGNANCWNVVTPDGRFLYASNAGSSTLAAFAISPTGALTPVGGTIAGINPTGSTNLDIAVNGDGRFLYTLNSGTGTIGGFAIQPDGTLQSLGVTEGLTANSGFNGIAAF
jgi:6-phosphogluconolactonase (cycloisomerase 2 family)